MNARKILTLALVGAIVLEPLAFARRAEAGPGAVSQGVAQLFGAPVQVTGTPSNNNVLIYSSTTGLWGAGAVPASATSLQLAYAGGNAIVEAGALGVTLTSTTNDASTVLTATKNPGSGNGGNGLLVTMGANSQDAGVRITVAGAGQGNGIEVAQSSTSGGTSGGNAFSALMPAASTGAALCMQGSGGGTSVFIESADGSGSAISGAATGRLRYNNSTGTWQVSTQGGAYTGLLTTLTQGIAFGTANTAGNSWISLVGGAGNGLFWSATNNPAGSADTSITWLSAGVLQAGSGLSNNDSGSIMAATIGRVARSGANGAANPLTLAAGAGTGTGTGSTINFQVSPVLGTGSTVQTLGTVFALSGVQSALSGTVNLANLSATFADGGTTSTTVGRGLYLNPTYNYTAASKTGVNADLQIDRIETSLATGTQYLMRLRAGAAGTTDVFSITNGGAISAGAGNFTVTAAGLVTGPGGLYSLTAAGSLTLGASPAINSASGTISSSSTWNMGNGRLGIAANGGDISILNTIPIGWGSGAVTGALTTGLSQESAGVLAVGTGAAGSIVGSIKCAALTGSGNVSGAKFLAGNGAAGGDAFAFTAATNTGFYRDASANVVHEVAGTTYFQYGPTAIFQIAVDTYLAAKVARYNGVNTAGLGVPAIYGSGRALAQTAANASLATYTVGAADGSFEIDWNVLATTSTSYNFSVFVTYTDESNTARTGVLLPVWTSGGTATNVLTNGAGPVFYGQQIRIRCKASTAITVGTSGTFTAVTYNAEASIKQIS